MGVYCFIIFWAQKGQFQGEHRGGFESPPPNRIFLTPRQLGLKSIIEGRAILRPLFYQIHEHRQS